MVIPAFSKKVNLPKGIWRELSLVEGDNSDKYQATLKMRGGSIIPTGKVVQNTTENSLDPLTLLVCPDENGKAEGSLYWDAGEGWDFKKGKYTQQKFIAKQRGNTLVVCLSEVEGNWKVENQHMAIIKVVTEHGIRQASGDLSKGIEIKL
mgnify:CR=1 FL=1